MDTVTIDTEPAEGRLAVEEKLRKVVKEARRIQERSSQAAEYAGFEFGYEYELAELQDDLKDLEKRISAIWSQNVRPWHENGILTSDEVEELWSRRSEAQTQIEKTRDQLNERGRNWTERAKRAMKIAANLVGSFATLISAYYGAKKALPSS